MAQTKSDWRRALLTARTAIPETTRRTASEEIARRVRALPDFRGARSILGYVALGAEVDVAGLLATAGESEIDVYVPNGEHTTNAPLWNAYPSGDIAVGREAQTLTYPVFAIVPGVGFDFSGVRLGRGGGFYDRALAALRRVGGVRVVGVAFECQLVAELPRDAWDELVDVVVSERRVLVANRAEERQPEGGAR